MVGGVMTTGRIHNRTKMRFRLNERPLSRGQKSIRLTPDAADLMRHIMITTGSLGADAPPDTCR